MIKVLKLYEPRRTAVARPREQRESRQSRGYDYEWSKISANHLRRSPACVECERKGRIIAADVVDHKIPIRFRPDLRLDRKNRWSLCHGCHQGIKKRMEAYAEKLGEAEVLILWCDEPETRPEALKFDRRRPGKEEMIV